MPSPAPRKLVLWIIWFAMLQAVVLYRFFLASEGESESSFPQAMLIALFIGPTAICLFIRFMVIPKIRHMAQMLPAMIVGVAIAESISFFGYFLFPAYQNPFFAISLVLVIIFAPTYATKL